MNIQGVVVERGRLTRRLALAFVAVLVLIGVGMATGGEQAKAFNWPDVGIYGVCTHGGDLNGSGGYVTCDGWFGGSYTACWGGWRGSAFCSNNMPLPPCDLRNPPQIPNPNYNWESYYQDSGDMEGFLSLVDPNHVQGTPWPEVSSYQLNAGTLSGEGTVSNPDFQAGSAEMQLRSSASSTSYYPLDHQVVPANSDVLLHFFASSGQPGWQLRTVGWNANGESDSAWVTLNSQGTVNNNSGSGSSAQGGLLAVQHKNSGELVQAGSTGHQAVDTTDMCLPSTYPSRAPTGVAALLAGGGRVSGGVVPSGSVSKGVVAKGPLSKSGAVGRGGLGGKAKASRRRTLTGSCERNRTATTPRRC